MDMNKLNKKITVLMQTMPGAKDIFGGHMIQLEKTKEYLCKLGVTVDYSEELTPNLGKYDIVHLFDGRSWPQAINALKQRKLVAFTPIYLSLNLFDSYNKKTFNLETNVKRLHAKIAKLLLFLKDKEKFLNNYKRDIAERINFENLLKYSHILLPNSYLEASQIEEDFNISNNYHVVPNAADISFKDAKPDEFIKKYKLKDFILCVARIAPRKNQLNLIKAIKRTNYHLVLIGPKHPDHLEYFRKCHRLFNRNVTYIEYIEHDLLPSAYSAAKVHILPSFNETTGLSSLEAGLAGCNVVITDRGYTREYFEDLAVYCNPEDVSSIQDAIVKAYNTPKSDRLKNRILNNYTWEHTAEETYKAYMKVLDKR